ncbi:MAG TPA: class I SAM-dependent methyltransferase [Thermoplasmata archaeon]|nr:class I SAM-dependent methyltransferase [Thermoplasmata archaeon]
MVGSDWTEDLFLKQGELFLRLHERGLEQSESEAKAIAALLKRNGLPEAASILDAPCGIGRHSIHLARMGYRVSGIDLSSVYIDRAKHFREKMNLADRLELKVGDLRAVGEMFKGRAFDAAINMWQSLGYWDEAADHSILRQLHGLTTEKGLLIVDVLNRDNLVKYLTPFGLTRFDDGTEQHEHRRLNFETSHLELLWEFYDRQGNDLKHKSTAKVRFRVYSLHELRELLGRAGWRPLEEVGSFQLDTVSPERKRLIVVSSKA